MKQDKEMREWTKEEIEGHLRINLTDKAGSYSAAVVVAALYKKLYGEFPKIGLSGTQAEYADSIILSFPAPPLSCLGEEEVTLMGHVEKETDFWITVHLPNSGMILELMKKDIIGKIKPQEISQGTSGCPLPKHRYIIGNRCESCGQPNPTQKPVEELPIIHQFEDICGHAVYSQQLKLVLKTNEIVKVLNLMRRGQ